MADVCKTCQCNNCWFTMPDGGPDDCHHCDCCLEDRPMTDCKKQWPKRSSGGFADNQVQKQGGQQ